MASGWRAEWAGGSIGPRCSFFDRWDGLALVRRVRQDADAVPDGHDVSGPGPGGLDPQARRRPPRVSRAAACRIRSLGLWLGAGHRAVPGEHPKPGQQGSDGQGGSLPRLVHHPPAARELVDAAVLPAAEGVFDTRVDSVGGVDLSVLAQPPLPDARRLGRSRRPLPYPS